MSQRQDKHDKLFTTGEIAHELGVRDHRVLYVIRRLEIEPADRAGHYRLFDQAAVDLIREEIDSRARLAS